MGEMRTLHEIAQHNVDVPTLVVHTFKIPEEEVESLCVQWYGVAERAVPEGAQLFFTLQSNKDDESWGGKPEQFRVAFIGQIKDWPHPGSVQAVADMMGDGDREGWVVYALDGTQVHFYASGLGPKSLMTRIILLGCPNAGIITPRFYNDPEVVKQEMDKASPKIKCPGCELMVREDDLEAQMAHMEKEHFDIVCARGEREGVIEQYHFWFDDD